MKKLFALGCFSLLISANTISMGQARDPEAAASVVRSVPSMSQRQPVAVDTSQAARMAVTSSMVFDAKTGGIVGQNALKQGAGLHPNSKFDLKPPDTGTIDGLNTLDTFDGAFAAENGPSQGRLFRFTMMGNDPKLGHTTVYPAPISEVSLTLLNADGSTLTTVPFTPFENLTLRSPNFSFTNYGSGHEIQYADAIHRAEFFHKMRSDWHTVLFPQVVNRVNITVPRFVNVQLADGSIIQARAYFIGTAADGSTFVLMLDLLFNFFFDNEVVNEINQGNFTTNGVNMTLFPNTYLFSLNTANPNTPGDCCVLGFHTYFLDSGVVPQDRWVTLYASWISPGVFGGGFQDVTALSHEISESFDDPFVNNATPVWQFPGLPATSTLCQANLENGDPIEVLANASVPITIGEDRHAFTYHPQNIVLLPWFEMGATSNAIDGAFSFPNESLLTASAVPCPQ